MENQLSVKGALEILKASGKKHTQTREQMLRFLAQSNRYVSAKEVHMNLSQASPRLSQDTVYRNLHEFSQMGILEETELNSEMHFRFHCVTPGSKHHHHHFICTNCGRTKELALCPMDFFQEQLPGCLIEDHRFEIFGKCESCH
ncbi:Fur family transcriptional regulator [Enterococcus sp. LJL98]